VAARGFTRRRSQLPETGGSGLLSSSLPLLAGCKERHHLQKQHNRNEQSVLVLFSPSQIWSFRVCFSVSGSFPLLQATDLLWRTQRCE